MILTTLFASLSFGLHNLQQTTIRPTKMEWKQSSQTYYVNKGKDVSNAYVNLGYVNYNYDSFGYSLGRESNSYKVPQWYVSELKSMYVLWVNDCDFKSLKRQSDILNKQLNMNPFVYKQSFNFVADSRDVNRYVNVYHLSAKDSHDVNKFALNLQNHMLKRFSLTKWHNSKYMDMIAQKVANKYDADKFSQTPGSLNHDYSGLKQIAKQYGLPVGNTTNTQYIEASVWFTYLKNHNLRHISLAELKAIIYYLYAGLFFDDYDSNYEHALFLTQSFKNGVFSVSFDHRGYLHFTVVDANSTKKNTRIKLIKGQY